MKLRRTPFFLLLFPLCFVFSERSADARRQVSAGLAARSFSSSLPPPPPQNFFGFRISPAAAAAVPGHHCQSNEDGELTIVERPDDGGIRELISDKFQERYQKWKDELLSTELGRRQWTNYSNNKHFILTITVASKEGQGAGTGKYQWDERGELVGATITLGNKLDRGFPDPIYFPVMSSLSSDESSYTISGNILAATKFAHEFGHVNQTAKMKSDLFQLQNKLMPVYNEILLKNGYNIHDRNLVDLARQMGGTPVEIWENREYWGEANAMLYLADRIGKESYHCSVYSKMRRNVKLYAKHFEERFNQIPRVKDLEAACSK